MNITTKQVQKIITTVDAGLCSGVGQPVPGSMCVEAAVCYGMGLPHGDRPTCVSPALRSLKITLNDSRWSSYEARARGLRKLAVLQLGTKEGFNDVEFATRVARLAVKVIAPRAKEYAAADADAAADAYAATYAAAAARSSAYAATSAATSADADAAASATYAASAARAAAYADAYAAVHAAVHAASARAAAYSARAAAYSAAAASASASASASADASAYDAELVFFADEVAKILIDMNVPGVKWLELLK